MDVAKQTKTLVRYNGLIWTLATNERYGRQEFGRFKQFNRNCKMTIYIGTKIRRVPVGELEYVEVR